MALKPCPSIRPGRCPATPGGPPPFFPRLNGTKPELLAHHYREGALPAKAFPYAMQAGNAAVARYASIEARARFQEALDLSRSLPP